MANQKIIDWFLKKYDSGEQITPQIIDQLVTGLRPRGRGRPGLQRIHLLYLALNHICTAEQMIVYLNKGNVSSVRKLVKKARNEGWEVVDFRNCTDKKGKKIRRKKGPLSKEDIKEVWIDNGEELHYFYFNLDHKGKLMVGERVQEFA